MEKKRQHRHSLKPGSITRRCIVYGVVGIKYMYEITYVDNKIAKHAIHLQVDDILYEGGFIALLGRYAYNIHMCANNCNI